MPPPASGDLHKYFPDSGDENYSMELLTLSITIGIPTLKIHSDYLETMLNL